MAALLQLASVEPRPELWGRYVAALNHLQGVMFLSVSMCAQLRGSPGWTPQGWAGSCDIAELPSFGMSMHCGHRSGVYSMAEQRGLSETRVELDAMHKELLHLIQMVDSHVNSCGCSHQRTTSTAAAFAKGKVNIISVIKRLRNHLVSGERYTSGTGTRPQTARQQNAEKTVDSSWGAGRWQHRSGQGKEQHSSGASGAQRVYQQSSPKLASSSSQANWRSGFKTPSPKASSNAKDRW